MSTKWINNSETSQKLHLFDAFIDPILLLKETTNSNVIIIFVCDELWTNIAVRLR